MYLKPQISHLEHQVGDSYNIIRSRPSASTVDFSLSLNIESPGVGTGSFRLDADGNSSYYYNMNKSLGERETYSCSVNQRKI